MEDDSLDKMDPYQRGANRIIWESMMSGSYKSKPSDDVNHRDYYADATESGSTIGNQLGSQEEASSTVEKYHEGRYVIGPMVVRVLPDGSPVPGGTTLPKDEDAEEYAAMRARPLPQFTNHHPNQNFDNNHRRNHTSH
ncbi:hypothetical protein AAG570_011811 [Ranatra chinensis]|uniref:Uncharacterized protein n=1 Tax=Ranatra chinensis TaxID=642074 RepID=A0ABD0YGZ8_9HEMI